MPWESIVLLIIILCGVLFDVFFRDYLRDDFAPDDLFEKKA